MLLKSTKRNYIPERDYCLILLCFLHGFRASEICSLRKTDIDLVDDVIYINRLKKGFSTVQPLLKFEKEVIRKWILKRDELIGAETDWLFISKKGLKLSRQQFYRIINKAGKHAGIKFTVHPHMLRHACGFALADRGIDTRLIQDYLGHRNIRHTVWYTASNSKRFYGIWERKNN